MRDLKQILAGAAASLLVGLGAAGADASTLLAFSGPTAEQPTDTTLGAGFVGAAGAAQLSFTLDGYASLDGQNFFEDDFTLSLNGAPILSGTWSMGGGGNDVVFFAPSGATINNTSAPGATFAGGNVLITTPLSIVGGLNQLAWNYTSLPGPSHAGFQGTGDEGWGLENILVTQGVPEPAVWSLMIAGFGMAGAMLRKARKLATA